MAPRAAGKLAKGVTGVVGEPQLSVVLPAYNEEVNLDATLAEVTSYLASAVPDHEVIVVDDGSRDGTPAIAARWAARHPRLRVVRHPVNRGYGAALRSGFAAARGRLVFFMDADGQFDIRDLERLLPLIEDHDGVLGYRLHRRDPWLRRVNAFGWNLLTRLLLGLPYRDIDCAFKLYRRDALAAIRLESEGATINAEMLARLRARGCRLVQVGVNHYPRNGGRATGARPDVILKAFGELFRLCGALRQERAC